MKVLSTLCQYEGMSARDKEKLCSSCEGRIPWHTARCPYCGTEQQTGMGKAFQAPLFRQQSLEDSLTSLYTPPYQGKRPQFPQMHDELEEGSHEEEESEPPFYKSVSERPTLDPLFGATVEEEEKSSKGSFLPILFLFGGLQFLLLGLMQLFFSKNEILRLEWNANYWFLYCLIGGPLLYLGMKKLRSLPD